MTMKAFFRKLWCIKCLMPKLCQIIYAAAVFKSNIHTHSHGSEVRWGWDNRQKARAWLVEKQHSKVVSLSESLGPSPRSSPSSSIAWARGLPSISLKMDRCQGLQSFTYSNITNLFINRNLPKINILFLFKVLFHSIFCGT